MIDPNIQNDLRAKYNPEGSKLRDYQLSLLDMLIDFNDICQSLGIKYWLSSGTLLGAIRHGGFIPWDDDIDVDMTKEDFNILINNFKESDKYVLQTHKNDPYYFWPYAKFRLKNKTINEKSQIDSFYKYKGYFIDVFIIENRYNFISRLMSIFPKILFKLSKKQKLNSISKMLFFILKKVSFKLSNIINTLTVKLPGKSYGHTYGTFFINSNRKREDIFPLKNIEFEGHSFLSPQDPNAYLSRMFGDYMKLPKKKDSHLNVY